MSVKDLVAEKLKVKERMYDLKKRSLLDGVGIIRQPSREEEEYFKEHDVITTQCIKGDIEDTFSFCPPLWNQRLSFVAKIIESIGAMSVCDGY